MTPADLDFPRQRRRLRWLLAALFVALLVPGLLLVEQAERRMKWEVWYQQQQLALALGEQIDARLAAALAEEEARSFNDYRFETPAANDPQAFRVRSPLSRLPVVSALPGVLGHFQVTPDGAFESPLLPATPAQAAALGAGSLSRRQALVAHLRARLEQADSLAGTPPPIAAPAAGAGKSRAEADLAERSGYQRVFDKLTAEPASPVDHPAADATDALGRIDDPGLSDRRAEWQAQAETAPSRSAVVSERQRRREQTLELTADTRSPAVRIFASELDPFAFARLDREHFVLYRNAWRSLAPGGVPTRFVQGALIEVSAFLEGAVVARVQQSTMATQSDISIAYRGAVLQSYRGSTPLGVEALSDIRGELLLRMRLSAPFSDLELIFSLPPAGAVAGAATLSWITAVFVLVLALGLLLLYRLGLGQIRLNEQQQDFVSAVSHELKTPLTSIRMYAEMLRAGWVDEPRRREYYDYLFSESERLSRLIDNVLTLARLRRHIRDPQPESLALAELLERVLPPLTGRAAQAEFELAVDLAAATTVVRVDVDSYARILLNLVDNAVKFAARSQPRRVDIRITAGGGFWTTSVRDFGPGVPDSQRKQIFERFYRSESELIRETPGTGIGLALVGELAVELGGQVEVVNREPGAEFRVRLPLSAAG